MPRFQYVALDARGQESTGSVEANSANEAIGHLRQAGYFPTGVYEQGKAPVARDGKVKRPRSARTTAPVVATPKRKTGITLFQRQKVKSKILSVTELLHLRADTLGKRQHWHFPYESCHS